MIYPHEQSTFINNVSYNYYSCKKFVNSKYYIYGKSKDMCSKCNVLKETILQVIVKHS